MDETTRNYLQEIAIAGGHIDAPFDRKTQQYRIWVRVGYPTCYGPFVAPTLPEAIRKAHHAFFEILRQRAAAAVALERFR